MKSYDRCEISRLSTDILSHIISLTSPKDACRCAVLCSALNSASNSEVVWENFIPSNILCRADDPLPAFSTKRELFFYLCRHDILIDNKYMTFRLERKTGANIWMLRSRHINIVWADSQYWQRVPSDDSRFGEVSTLTLVWWLQIYAHFNIKELSSENIYVSYLVFKLEDDADGLDVPQRSYVRFGGYDSTHTICLQPEEDEMLLERDGNMNIRTPKERQDGWMEIALGEFYVHKGLDDIFSTGLEEIDKLYSKRGLIIEGIEFRPKENDD